MIPAMLVVLFIIGWRERFPSDIVRLINTIVLIRFFFLRGGFFVCLSSDFSEEEKGRERLRESRKGRKDEETINELEGRGEGIWTVDGVLMNNKRGK